jgi:hypothetical protein
MKRHALLCFGLFGLGGLIDGRAATGIEWIDGNTNLTFSADVRLRYEVDWDSQDAAGVERDDRHRGRLRPGWGQVTGSPTCGLPGPESGRATAAASNRRT